MSDVDLYVENPKLYLISETSNLAELSGLYNLHKYTIHTPVEPTGKFSLLLSKAHVSCQQNLILCDTIYN